MPGRRGRPRGRILTPAEDTKGYLVFRVCLPDGRQWRCKIHRVVAAAFIGPCPGGMQVNHKDGDKKNNRADNLEYATCGENVRHGWAAGLYRRRQGESAGNAKLTEDDVRTIRAIYPTKSTTELAELYGVSQSQVWAIVRRKSWTHVN